MAKISDFYSLIKRWLRSNPHYEVREVSDQNNSGKYLEVRVKSFDDQIIGAFIILFFDEFPDFCTIVREIQFGQKHLEAQKFLDDAYRKQIKFDWNYEFSGYGATMVVNYDEDNILKSIQFQKNYYNFNVDKNDLFDKIETVYSAGYRAITFINKELN